jgi:excisionase family DNA binding protein
MRFGFCPRTAAIRTQSRLHQQDVAKLTEIGGHILTRTPLATSRERVKIAEAVVILGLSDRTVRALAERGEIPGAAKIGRRWTFSLARLRDYVRQKETEACRSAGLTVSCLFR